MPDCHYEHRRQMCEMSEPAAATGNRTDPEVKRWAQILLTFVDLSSKVFSLGSTTECS